MKEKTADEMFDELGWNYKENHANGVSFYDYEDNEISIIYYDDYDRRIIIDKFEGITMQELQAINKKVEKLGWI